MQHSRSDDGDRLLVRRMLTGDEPAFDAFFERYFHPLYRFALTRLQRDEDAAEEVVQAALGKAVLHLGGFRGEARLFTWLCTFCRHEIHAYLRRRERLGQEIHLVEDSPDVQAALESLAAVASGDPEDSLRRREVARLVQVALEHLPARYARALEWKHVEGRSVRDIAEQLGVTEKAAESILGRARIAFRESFLSLVPAGGTP